MTRNDPVGRPAHRFGGKVTLHTGPAEPSYIVLPVVPTRPAQVAQ